MGKIENKEQYNWAVGRVEELLYLVNDDDDTPANDSNSIELKLLSELVADYSEEHFLLSVSQSRVSEYISGKSEPTLKVARLISKNLNIDANIVLGV